MDHEGSTDRRDPFVERQHFFDRYQSTGRYSEDNMGLSQGRGIIWPSDELLAREATLDRTSNRNVLQIHNNRARLVIRLEGDERPIIPFTKQSARKIAREISGELKVEVGDDVERLVFAMAEGSCAVTGIADLLSPTRLAIALQILNRNIARPGNVPLWMMDGNDRYQKIQQFLHTTHLAEVIPLGLDSQALADVLEVYGRVLSHMAKGDIQTGQAVMEVNPYIVTGIGAYLFGILHAGLEREMFIDERGKFDIQQLKQMVFAFTQAETAPRGLDPVLFSNAQARYSSYLSMCLDEVLLRTAPLAFAFGNRALLEEMQMGGMEYIDRARASTANFDVTGFGLSQLNEIRHQHLGRDMAATATLKSVASALGGEISEHLEEFNHLLLVYGITIPNQDQPQFLLDFENAEKLNELLTIWRSQNDGNQLDLFIRKLYAGVQKRTDLLRGSMYIPDESIDGVVREAMERPGITVKLILNYQGKAGSDPRVLVLNRETNYSNLLSELRFHSAEKPSVREIIDRWYAFHEGEYPYGAVHLYGQAGFTRELGRSNLIPQTYHLAEERLIPASHTDEAGYARLAYKKHPGSRHV